MISLGASVQQVDATAELLKQILADPQTYEKRVKEIKKLISDLNKKMEASKAANAELEKKRQAAEKLHAEARTASDGADARHKSLDERESAVAKREADLEAAKAAHTELVKAAGLDHARRDRELAARQQALEPTERRLAKWEKQLQDLHAALSAREAKAKEFARSLVEG